MTSRRPTFHLLAAALLLGVALLRLGGAPLFDADEGAFAEATREMLASGDFGHTTLNGEPRWDKPILTYWFQAAAVAVLGPVEAAFRLPSVLAAWAWVVAAFVFARPRFGEAAAWVGAAVLATSAGVLAIGRAATADALLNLWLALAAFDAWRHVERHDAGDPSGARVALRRAAVWVALGVLTKGPVALLVPGAAILLWIAGTPRTQWAARLRALVGDVWAWALLIAVAAPWYAYALHRHGRAFIDGFFMRHNVERFAGTLEGHGGSIAYYLVVVPVLLLPWSALLGPLLARARSAWREPLPRFLLGWAGFVTVFFTLSGTKLPHYALYGITPLALLAGRAWTGAGARMRAGVIATIVAMPLVFAAAMQIVVAYVAPMQRDPLYRALLSAPADTLGLWASAAAFAAAGALALRVVSPARFAPQALAGLALAMAAWFHAAFTPWLGDRLQGAVKRGAIAARADAASGALHAVQWGVHRPSLAVYLETPAPRRAPKAGEVALVREDRLPELIARLPPDEVATPPYRVLHDERGLLTIRWGP
jgi:4-amino-4-deoxy-L-arabinose transferase-like glycosyltransferase